ncbi:hypothetical protein AM1_5399 [Acaryochloris marina MBIC11017]|uniref:Uncharacterized protein n=1 Tax=Acaryochloris marina (strain MBIC 11017) TaxID=329726 RepID=B0CBV5_ACAM1|nr:hypothetical protein AM1_5399 [Acaryochloris marina MBIC11017]
MGKIIPTLRIDLFSHKVNPDLFLIKSLSIPTLKPLIHSVQKI